jgi:hypothetical protein
MELGLFFRRSQIGIMAIKFVRKFKSDDKPNGKSNLENLFDKFKSQAVEIHLKELFYLYNDVCIIFNGNYYCGKHGLMGKGENPHDYEAIGQILRNI